MRLSTLFGTVLVCVLFGCGDDEAGETSGDAGSHDGGRDVGTLDASREAGVDAAPVTGGDASSEVASDAEVAAVGERFSALYASIIGPTCSGCHVGDDHLSSLDMSTARLAYQQLVGVQAEGSECGTRDILRVAPGNAEASLLIEKLGPAPDCGARMPHGLPPLLDAQIERIRRWIDQGALDD